MGYTHYFSGNITKKQFDNVVVDLHSIVEHCKTQGIDIANGLGEAGSHPIVEEDKLYLNGVEDDSYETFTLEVGETDFECCKTNRRPYDVAVCMVLLSLLYYSDNVSVRSDGDIDDEWKEPITQWRTLFDKRGVVFSITDREFKCHKLDRLLINEGDKIQSLFCSSNSDNWSVALRLLR